jgi:oxaloacetate decarboxylase alpha subunit
VNLKEIKEMIQLMNENNLSEFELENDGLKVRLKKTPAGVVQETVIQEARPVQNAVRAEAAAPKENPKAVPPTPAPAKTMIKSPMVGTFYAAPAPDAAPFVQAGGMVEVGQVVCIIEAMKLMNEIKAEIHGKIAEILVHNGDPVEFGQPLFVLE